MTTPISGAASTAIEQESTPFTPMGNQGQGERGDSAALMQGEHAPQGVPSHPDIWGWSKKSLMEKPTPGSSWAQWQLENHFLSERMSIGHVNQVIFMEWIPQGVSEQRLSALRLLASTKESYTLDILRWGNLWKLVFKPSNAQEEIDAEVIAHAVLEANHRGRDSSGKREPLGDDVIGSTAEILARRWTRSHPFNSPRADIPAYFRSISADFLLGFDLSEEEVEQVFDLARDGLLVSLRRALGNALDFEEKPSRGLGFLREISEGETALLRRFLRDLGRELGQNDWMVRMRPFREVMGYLTPERLLVFASLVEEYNWEWALAAVDWSTSPIASERR